MADESSIAETVASTTDVSALLGKPAHGLDGYLERIREIDARLKALADVRSLAISRLLSEQEGSDRLGEGLSDLQVKTEQFLDDIDAGDEGMQRELYEHVATVKVRLEKSVLSLEALNAQLQKINGARAILVRRRTELVRIMSVTLNSDYPNEM